MIGGSVIGVFRGVNMTELLQIYRCNVCGNMVEVLHTGVGKLVCCGQLMQLIEVKGDETGKEKHLPVVKRSGNKIKVEVGSVRHPMEENHYIEWIEVIANGNVYRKHLNPGDEPTAEFQFEAERFTVRAYCNVHGLWQVEVG